MDQWGALTNATTAITMNDMSNFKTVMVSINISVTISFKFIITKF